MKPETALIGPIASLYGNSEGAAEISHFWPKNSFFRQKVKLRKYLEIPTPKRNMVEAVSYCGDVYVHQGQGNCWEDEYAQYMITM